MPRRSASEVGRAGPPPAAVARFRRGLDGLFALDDEAPLIVAVSGGADSLALLLLAHAVLGDRCIAATVDHGIRPRSADEARFVADVCMGRDIEHHLLTGPLPDKVGGTANLSARARALRYGLLGGLSEDFGHAPVATAHHADDQVETLVMRLNRGAGVAGLSGIRRRSPTHAILRPLLTWRHAELAALVGDCGIAAIDDPSNSDDRFDRARLRKVLRDVDWLDVDRVVASVAAIGDAEDALQWAARRAWTERCVVEDDRLVLDPRVPREILRRLVIRCINRFEPDREPTGPAIMRAIAALENGQGTMLGNVLVSVVEPRTFAERWVFRRAPPRAPHVGASLARGAG